MDERIVRFVAAMRAAGVRISLAESSDALQAASILGVKDREHFRLSLRATLVKEARDLPVFNELFPLFFNAAGSPSMEDLFQELSPEEQEAINQALQELSERLRKLLERLMRGEPLSQEELERLAKLVGLNQAQDIRYREWMAQRLKRAIGLPEARSALQELLEALARMGIDPQLLEQLRQLVEANQQALGEQLEQFAGQRIAENSSQLHPDESRDNLLDRPFQALSDKDMETLRGEVMRLAKALRTRIALRQKRAHNGQLDAKATIRANLKHSSVPFDIRHRERTLKPRLVVLCDISNSMRFCSELMLSLIYTIQDQISKTFSFAYIDHLEFISPDFVSRTTNQAVAHVLKRMPAGYYNTDLGASLKGFQAEHLGTLDSRTTLIIVGDGRNNYNNPQLELLNMLSRRSSRLVWLNPEPRVMWGQGDSDMLKYEPLCHIVLQVSNLAELVGAVDQLLILR